MTATKPVPAGLFGRAAELQVLFDLVDGVREGGRTRALVLQGEPGIGKTSLLTATTQHAIEAGVRVLSTTGAQAEAELPFSGLHQLLLPLLAGGARPRGLAGPADAGPRTSGGALDRLERLPAPQRDALAGAFGLAGDAAPDRFAVALALLTLLSEEAERRPLLCVIDDAQWLDDASVQALAFVARRLTAESLVLAFAASERCDELGALPQLLVDGLAEADAADVLAMVVPGRLDERVRERILAEARGNPLALIELPRGLSPAQLAGGFGVPAVMSDPGSLSHQIEESFLRRVEALPVHTQQLLLIAAAEPVGDPALLWRAAARLRIANDALAPTDVAGLIEVGVRVQFRHPLVRSAIYRTAPPSQRRNAHRVLGEVTDPHVDPDRRAWHLAEAAAGPDEEVALALEHSAERAQARGGPAAAAAFLERAVALTADQPLRTRRALAAAQAKFEAAAPDDAAKLLATAEMGRLDDLQRACVERLRGQIAFARSGSAEIAGLTIGPQAPALLLDAARRLSRLDAELARETYLEAITAAMCTGSTSGDCGVRAVAEAARQAPPGPEPPRAIDVLLDSLIARFTEPYATAVAPLRQALHALADTGGGGDEHPRWLWFACPIAPEPLALDLWDDEKWHELSTRAVQLCRNAGALAVLPQALTYRASMHVLAGEFQTASGLIEEAYALAEATGSVPLRYASMLLAAWRGREAEAVAVIDACIADANARGVERTLGMSQSVTSLLHNGLGRYEDAFAAAQAARAYFPTDDLDDLGPPGWALVELVEAAVRSGRRDVAADAVDRLGERTQASGSDWALGIEARSRALLSEGEVAERFYREALERLNRTRIRVELPRTRLHYGEWLRREHRRVDAREELRLAHEAFAAMGAEAFAERARRELTATGERVPKRREDTRDRLTAQEEQIARLARDGLTNPEIAVQLFLSPRTVEYHLHKVFAKLAIKSRMGLHHALPGAVREAEPA